MTNLINWGELSRLLSGSRSVIRANRIPKKHKVIIDKLIKACEEWENEATMKETIRYNKNYTKGYIIFSKSRITDKALKFQYLNFHQEFVYICSDLRFEKLQDEYNCVLNNY